MNLPNNSIQRIPFTSTKLNFYLAQCNRNKKINTQNSCGKKQNMKIAQSLPYTKDKNCHNISSGPRIDQNPLRKLQQQTYIQTDNNLFENKSFVYANTQKDPDTSKELYNNDSLDAFLTDRDTNIDTVSLSPRHEKTKLRNQPTLYNLGTCNSRIYDKQSQLMSNNSFCANKSNIGYFNQSTNYRNFDNSYSRILNQDSNEYKLLPKQNGTYCNNLQYFSHHKNEQEKRAKKKVNWKIQPTKNTFKLQNDDSFKQIARQLSRITSQLNNNSSRLQEMNKLYGQFKRQNPQDSIKRANLKYAVVDVSQTNKGQSLKHRPYVQYEDKMYRDPRYLIWQPLHSQNSYSLYS